MAQVPTTAFDLLLGEYCLSHKQGVCQDIWPLKENAVCNKKGSLLRHLTLCRECIVCHTSRGFDKTFLWLLTGRILSVTQTGFVKTFDSSRRILSVTKAGCIRNILLLLENVFCHTNRGIAETFDSSQGEYCLSHKQMDCRDIWLLKENVVRYTKGVFAETFYSLQGEYCLSHKWGFVKTFDSLRRLLSVTQTEGLTKHLTPQGECYQSHKWGLCWDIWLPTWRILSVTQTGGLPRHLTPRMENIVCHTNGVCWYIWLHTWRILSVTQTGFAETFDSSEG